MKKTVQHQVRVNGTLIKVFTGKPLCQVCQAEEGRCEKISESAIREHLEMSMNPRRRRGTS